MEKIDLYYKIGNTIRKIDSKAHKKLSTYLKNKWEDIRVAYLKWYEEKDVWAFPERVLEEPAMDSLMKETGIKQRCIEIFMNGTTEDDKIVVIMGVGHYNSRVFKENDPSMHAIKEIEYEQKFGKKPE